MACGDFPDKTTGETLLKDATTINEIVTSPDDLTNPASDEKQKETLVGLSKKFGVVIVGDYVDGTVLTNIYDGASLTSNGTYWAPVNYSDLPITIDATTYPNPEDHVPALRLYGDINSSNISTYTDLVFDSVADMISGSPKITWSNSTIGTQITTGSTRWKQISFSNPAVLSDFEALNQPVVSEFGADTTGVVDSTLAIKQAISAAKGSVILDDGGVFLTDGTLTDSELYLLTGGGIRMEAGKEYSTYVRSGINRADADNNVSGGFVIGGGTGDNGTVIKGGGNPSWPKLKPTAKMAPQQLQMYHNTIQGVGYPTASNIITKEYGDDLSLDLIRPEDTLWFGGTPYKVVAKVSDSAIQISTLAGADPSFTPDVSDKRAFYIIYELTQSVCDIDASGNITWLSGEVFSGSPVSKAIVDGVQYETAQVYTERTSGVLGYSDGAKTNISVIFKNTPSATYLSLLRLQGLYGPSEEVFAAYVTPGKRTFLENQFAGDGTYNPIFIRTGDRDDYFKEVNDFSSSRVAMSVRDNGNIAVGGGFTQGDGTHRFVVQNDKKTTVPMAVGGTIKSYLASMATEFHVDNTFRKISFGTFNDFTAGFIQGEDGTNNAQALQIQPTESAASQLFVGKHNNFSIDAKIVVGDPTAGPVAHTSMIAPAQDNTYSVGLPTLRPSVIYAASGSISTSDELLKDLISDIPSEWLDAWESLETIRFKFKDSIVSKGDGARWHVGKIAQHIEKAFADKGLDAFEIGVLCRDSWDDQYYEWDEERWVEKAIYSDAGELVKPEIERYKPAGRVKTKDAGEIYGVRYDQAIMLDNEVLKRRVKNLESIVQEILNNK